MLARRITFLRTLRTKLNHLLTYCCRLFVALEKVKSYRISNFQTLFAKHPGVGGVHTTDTRHAKLAPSVLCFHNLTNPFFRNPFLFTSIQNPRGVGGIIVLRFDFFAGQENSAPKLLGRKVTKNAKSAKLLSPFNAVFRHSMHGNTV